MPDRDEIRARVARHVCSMVTGAERADAVMDDVVAPLLRQVDEQRDDYDHLHELYSAVQRQRDEAVAELRRAEDEHAEFLEELDVAFDLEDGEESRYSNPEGAAEAIYVDVAAAYKAERDAARAALAEIRDRHQRHGDRCGACDQRNQMSNHPTAKECDACWFPHPCWTRTTAERGLGAEEET